MKLRNLSDLTTVLAGAVIGMVLMAYGATTIVTSGLRIFIP